MKEIIRKLKELADEFYAAASNEKIWGMGSDTQEDAIMHETYSEENFAYGNMVEDVIATLNAGGTARDCAGELELLYEREKESDSEWVGFFDNLLATI